MSHGGLRFLRPYLNSKLFRCRGFGSEERFIAQVQRSRSFVGVRRQRQWQHQHQQCRCQFSSSARALTEEENGEADRFERQAKQEDSPIKVSGAAESSPIGNANGADAGADSSSPAESADSYYHKRMEKLREFGAYENLYPRLGPPIGRLMSLDAFRIRYANLKKEQTDTLFTITLRGRVYAVRHGGSKLLFFTIAERNQSIQIICSLSSMATSGVTENEFKRFSQVVRRGDWFSISGYPEKTKSGAVSLRAVHLPQILSPSLHEHPTNLADKELRARKRHVHLIANPEAGDILRLRTEIEYSLQTYFREESFTKVSTPILAARAGGAAARPFETVATEFVNRPLQLRVAPELFLKRLIVGGIKGVYEIGPVFRNEGIGLSHNPEFTMCEFYKPLANLQELMDITQKIFKRVQKMVETRRKVDFPRLPELDVDFGTPIQKLDFIETIEKALGQRMPDLNSSDSVDELVRIMKRNDIALPSPSPMPSTSLAHLSSLGLDSTSEAEGDTIDPSIEIAPKPDTSAITLPRLLDTLSKNLIEPQCGDPTFIIHHPTVMSPLAKSFIDPRSGQTVSARAELFVRGREYVNCYEEENSPFEQRRKIEEQILLRKGGHDHHSVEEKALASVSSDNGDESAATTAATPTPSSSEPAPWSSSRTGTNQNTSSTLPVRSNTSSLVNPSLDEENYLEALEWALPPTGGWGVGVDRLVMLFSGQNRIANVLPFGTLRNVVGLHHAYGQAASPWRMEKRKAQRMEKIERMERMKSRAEKKKNMKMKMEEDGNGNGNGNGNT